MQAFCAQTGRNPSLAAVIVGDDPASRVYVRNKLKECARLNIHSLHRELDAKTTQQQLNEEIEKLNGDDRVDGILVQSPLPGHLSFEEVLDRIDPSKDPDGLTAENIGLMLKGRSRANGCTPQGVIELLKHFKIATRGKSALVVGRSQIVGLPMSILLTQQDATVTVAHSKTPNLKSLVKEFEIVVVAAGRPHLLSARDFKKGAAVIDVGIHRMESGKLCGDVDPDGAQGHLSALSPVPGGVGPMTISVLMENTIRLAEIREGAKVWKR